LIWIFLEYAAISRFIILDHSLKAFKNSLLHFAITTAKVLRSLSFLSKSFSFPIRKISIKDIRAALIIDLSYSLKLEVRFRFYFLEPMIVLRLRL